MFDKIKDLLSNWKVSVALVGGAVVVATTFGTCTFDPAVAPAEEEPSGEVESVGEEASTTTEASTTSTVETSNSETEGSEENTTEETLENN